jgi:RNA polymerase sigma-70 factor, ECF subfamily
LDRFRGLPDQSAKTLQISGNLFPQFAYFIMGIKIGMVQSDISMEDIEIVRIVKKGDTNSFSLLVERYHRAVLNFIFKIVRRPDIVEDIGQEVFLSAYQSLGNFDEKRGVPFSAWLFTIARNRCISEIRKLKKMPLVLLDDIRPYNGKDEDPGHHLEQKERRKALEAALDMLDEPFRSTIVNSIEGMSIEEMAGNHGVPQTTVKTRLFRAREKLKNILKVHIGGNSL